MTNSGRSAWFVGVLVLMVYLIFASYVFPPPRFLSCPARNNHHPTLPPLYLLFSLFWGPPFPPPSLSFFFSTAQRSGVALPLEFPLPWNSFLDVTAAFMLAAFCFAVLYLYIVRIQGPGAFSADLHLGEALYFSIVTMTTTGYGDISPRSGLAKFVVGVQILFGFLYTVLFFSIFAGLAGRGRPA